MKKILFILLIFICSSLCHAYVPYIEYKNVKVKFYDEDINKTIFLNILNEIPEGYFTKLTYISFLSDEIYCQGNAGLYWISQKRISICDRSKQTLIHELAHHKQNLNKENLDEIINHGESFFKYEEEIWRKIK